MRISDIFKNLCLSLFSICLFFGLLEIGCRIYDHHKHKLNEFESFIESQGIKADNKAAGEKRVFIVGESAARGVPYTLESSTSGFLQTLLIDNDYKNIKIVNLGVPGRHSFYQRELVPILSRYKADLVILYAGNNDTRDFANVMRDVPFALWDFKLTWQSQFYRGLKSKLMSFKKDLNKMFKKHLFDINYNQDDVWHWTDTYLKKKKSYLDDPERGIKRKMQALQDYQDNLNSLVAGLRKNNIRVIVSNLPIVHGATPAIGDWTRKDYDFKQKVLFLSSAEEASWKNLFENGEKALESKNYSGAKRFFEAAEKINDTYPMLSHNLGKTYEALGDFTLAKKMYVRGKDLQVQSPGGDSYKTKALKTIAEENKVTFLDLQEPLEEMSPNGIVGQNFFLDHCHPNSIGHKLIAAVLFTGLCRSEFIACKPEQSDWHNSFKQLFGGEMTPENLAREYLLVAFYHFKGTSWGNKPEYDKAIEYLLLAQQITPQNKDIYPLLAAAYWNTQKMDKAKESLDTLKTLNAVEYEKTLKDFPFLSSLHSTPQK